MAYNVFIEKRVLKYIRKLKDKKLRTTIRNAIYDEIAADPYEAGDHEVGDLHAFYAYKFHYQKSQYRIAYTIDDNGDLVIIVLVGTRENFYDVLKRLI